MKRSGIADLPLHSGRVPAWLMWSVVRAVRLFNRHQGELLAFFTTMATRDVVAPATGSRTLEQHFLRLASSANSGGEGTP